MNDSRHEAFGACLAALENGEDLDACLEQHPDLAEELRPLLETAQIARSMADDHVPNAAFHRSRSRLLGRAAQLRDQKSQRQSLSFLGRTPSIAFAALGLVLTFFISWIGVVEAAQALPGDPLYPIKRSAEDVRLRIVPDMDAKRAIKVKYEQRRADEVTRLLDMGRVEEVTFEGILQERETERWTVEGIPVKLAPDTQIIGDIEFGQVVEVSGKTQTSGDILASIIRLHSYQLIGQVESITATEWVVSGVRLIIRRDSQLDTAARINDQVIVLVEVNSDSSLHALAILRLLQPELITTLTPAKGVKPTMKSEEIEIIGIVEAISSSAWSVAGQQIHIAPDTEIKDNIAVGDYVKVHILVTIDGSLIAREIEMDTDLQEDRDQEHKEEDEQDFESGDEDLNGDKGSNDEKENQRDPDDDKDNDDENNGSGSIGTHDDDDGGDNSGSGSNDDGSSDEDNDHDGNDHGGDGGDGEEDGEEEKSTSINMDLEVQMAGK